METQTSYACKAAAVTAFGGRCRNDAGPDGFCHNPHQPGDELAMPAQVILLNLWMSNQHLHEEFNALGFPTRDRSIVYTQQRHSVESLLIPRSFEGYRPIGDTGCSVFGKPPLKGVTRLDGLARQLVDAGFIIDGIPHGENATDGGKVGIRMVVKFRHGTLDEDLYPREPGAMDQEQRRFYWKLLGKSWGKTHVWDNIPRHYFHHEDFSHEFHVHSMESDGSGLVQMLRPKMDQLMRMDVKSLERSVRFALSTINCRIPIWCDDRLALSHNDGYWAVKPAA